MTFRCLLPSSTTDSGGFRFRVALTEATWSIALLLSGACVLWLVSSERGGGAGGIVFSTRQSGTAPPLSIVAQRARVERDFPDFVDRVLGPTIGEVVEVDTTTLNQALDRMRPSPKTKLSDLLHYIHLTDEDSVVVTNEGAVPILQLLLNADIGAKHYQGAKPMFRSRYGVRFTSYQKLMLGTKQPSAEAHPGQVLSILASHGVCLTHSIQLPGEPPSTLREVLDDQIANFFLGDGEIYWQAVALALYVPPNNSWRNRFGEEFTFDMLSEELLRRDLADSACAGTHRMIALTVLWRVHCEMPILGPSVEQRVKADLMQASRALVRSQDTDGSWSPAWYKGLGTPSVDRTWMQVSITDRVITTGHHLEWLMLLPDDIRPPDLVFARAARFLMSVMPNLMQDPQWVDDWYCPATHALRSIKLLSAPSESRRHGLEEKSRRPIILPHDSSTSTSLTFQSRKEEPTHLRYMAD